MMTALRYCRCNGSERCFSYDNGPVGNRSPAVFLRQGPISNVANTVLLLRDYLRRRRRSYFL